MKPALILLLLLPLALIAGCKEEIAADPPDPAVLTEDATGYYCQMVIQNHPGPKAQTHLEGAEEPLWFAQVRDGLAYLKSGERSGEVLVLYVNDMGRADSWDAPGDDNWIDADAAYFVVGSDAVGGMGAPEIAPFGDIEQANAFAAERGGRVLRLQDIPADAVLSPVEPAMTGGEHKK